MKIVTSAGLNAVARLSTLGITVVLMSSSDVYMAMQQGSVDGCMVDFQLPVSRRFGDLIKHVIPHHPCRGNILLRDESGGVRRYAR